MSRIYVDNLVSVITPVYNAEKYIEPAIQSVISQDYKDIEIVLVDDCSNDKSEIIIKNLQKQYSNIVYYRQEQNKGAGAARNKALELARGQYVAFLDSDDIWKSAKLSKQISKMKAENSAFSYAAIEMIDANGKMIKGKRNIKEKCDYNYLLHNTIIATSSVVVDRKVLGDFKMSLRRGGQDYATWLKLLRTGTVAVGINETLVQYRVTEDSLSANKFNSIRQVWDIQTSDEGINKIIASWHVICFAFNAFKKYFF